jgi:soluble lytic murein transglycosylase
MTARFPGMAGRGFLAVLGATCACLPALAADELAVQRAAFVAAYEAATDGSPAPVTDEELADYPLFAYLEAARLRRALRTASEGPARQAADSASAAFLETHADDPVGRMVRAAWLESLANRRQWRQFLDAYAGATIVGQTLRCQALTARIELGLTAGIEDEAVTEWLTPESAADECDPVFEWLRLNGRLDAELIERRARLALDAGEWRLARWLARSLPEEQARPVRDWATLLQQPQAAVDAILRNPDVTVERDALLAGWTRLARTRPDAARDRFDALVASRGLDEEASSPFARELALGLAWSRRPALPYFERVEPADFDELTHAWHARAAVWARDWATLRRAVESMPPELRAQPAWRYWLARALEREGERQRARQLYESVVPTDNWYAVLSAARIARPFAPHAVEFAFDPGRLEALRVLPAFVRARELLLAGMHEFAPAEWRAGYEPLDAAGKRAAVILAHEWGWYFQAIASAAEQRFYEDYALLYPRPYPEGVEDAARASRLPETLIYAVVRQESLFQPYAVSPAGAVGLMQLMPATARRTATAMRRPRPGVDSLKEPTVNLSLGAGHLAELVDQFDGQVLLALAAYNAGPTAARRWLPDARIDADAWVENIPYNETRGYVQRVMWHSVVFEWLLDGEPEDARSWLVQVSPSGS